MNRTINRFVSLFALIAVFVMFPKTAKSQQFAISVTPSVQCFAPGTNTGLAQMLAPSAGATSYSWSIASPAPSCTALFTVVPNSLPSGTQAIIYYPCCGEYTVFLAPYVNGTTPAGPQAVVINSIVCPSGFPVTGNSVVCLGTGANLTAGTATSYAWVTQSTGSGTVNAGNNVLLSFTPTANTNYTVTGVTAQGCTASATGSVGVTAATITAAPASQTICANANISFSASSGAINTSSFTNGTSITGIQWYAPNGNAITPLNAAITTTAAAAGVYTAVLTYTGQAGTCSATAVSSVNISTSFPITITPVSPTICPGNNVTLTAASIQTAASSYTWSTGSGTIVGNPVVFAPTVQTTYTVDALYGSCPGTGTVTVSMASITPTISASSPSICPNTSITLTGSGALSYSFHAFPGAAPPSFTLNKTSFNTATHVPTGTMLPIQYCVVGYSLGCTGTVCTTINQMILSPTLTALTPSICPGSSVMLVGSGGAGTSYTFSSVNGGSVIGTSSNGSLVNTPPVPLPHTYSLTVDSAGCTGNSGLFVVNELTLYPTLSASSASVCSGTQFTLSSNRGAGTTYSFLLPGSPVTTVQANTTNSTVTSNTNLPNTYTVMVDSIGCKGAGTLTVGILNLANTLTLTPSSASICPGTQFTLNAYGGTTYSFFAPPGVPLTTPNPTVNKVIIIGPTTGNYPITYTVASDSSSCTGFKTISISELFLNATLAANPATVCAGMPVTFTAGGVGQAGTTSFQLVQTAPSLSTLATFTNNTTSHNPVVQTVYALYSDSAGCTDPFPFPQVTVYMYPGLTLTASATSPSICSGTNDTLSVLGPTNAAYVWSAPNGTNSPNVISNGTQVVVNPTIATIYTVTATDPLGCTGTETVLVGIDLNATLPLTLTPSPNSSTLCFGASVTIKAFGGLTYSWSPVTGLSNITGDSTTANPNITTIYTVTGSNNAGCFGTASYTVNVGAIQAPTITASSNAVCSGYQATLTAFGANSYTWASNNSTTTILQQSVSVPAGIYTVTGSNGGNCLATKVITISPKPNFTINITASSPTTCIENNNPKFSKAIKLTATSPASQYNWFPFNPCCMTYSLGNTTDVRPTASTCYTVIGTSADCSGTGTICLTVIPQFTMLVTPPLPAMCLGDSLNLNISGIDKNNVVGPTSAFTYSWTEAANAPPISITNNLTQSVTVFPKNTTTYTVEMFDSRKCASVPRLVTVTVFPRPITAVSIPTINNVPTNTVCYVGIYPGAIDNIITLTAENKNEGLPFGVLPTYTWTSPYPTSFNSILTPPNQNYVTVSAPLRVPTTVVYTVASGYNGIPGCREIDTVTVKVVDCRPVYTVNFNTAEENDTICARTCITFVNNDTLAGKPQKLTWTFDGGAPRTSTLEMPTVCYNLPGKFNVILRVENPYPTIKPDGSAPGSTLTIGYMNYIKVVDVPNVTIFSPGQLRSDTTIRFGQTVTLKGSGAKSYSWSPSYNISSMTSTQVIVKPYRTTQYILTGYNSGACSSADTVNVIVIEDCGEMFVPTAFSPNGDGHNDVLKVNGICLQTMTFMIFNRWGEKIFETTDQEFGWDGRFRGEDVNTGVYAYRLEGKTFDGKGFSAKGNVTLVR